MNTLSEKCYFPSSDEEGTEGCLIIKAAKQNTPWPPLSQRGGMASIYFFGLLITPATAHEAA